MADVSVTLGYKINMGNYETLHLEIGYSEPVLASETKEQAVDRVYNFVEQEFIKRYRQAVKAKDEADS